MNIFKRTGIIPIKRQTYLEKDGKIYGCLKFALLKEKYGDAARSLICTNREFDSFEAGWENNEYFVEGKPNMEEFNEGLKLAEQLKPLFAWEV